jgi:hypothetical protein
MYFTQEGQFRLHLLTDLLTDSSFQSQLKEQFVIADYDVTHVGERYLIPKRVQEYLSQLEGEDYRFASTVLDRTIYVPFNLLIEKLKQMTEKFLEQIQSEPFYIILNDSKFASMALMLIKIFPLFVKRNFLFATSESKLPPNSNVLIIDDATYTGTNLEGMIDTINYNNLNVNIHVVIPYMAKFMYEALPKLYPVFFYEPYLMLYMKEYLVENNLPLFSNEVYTRFEAFDKLEFHDQLPLYFDHTVASRDSSYPTIYLEGIVPNGIDYGPLIEYYLDLDVRESVYQQYFEELLPPPM